MLLFFWLDREECEVVLVNFAFGLMKTTVSTGVLVQFVRRGVLRV